MKAKRLGKYLEWHGSKIRVRVPVPTAKRAIIGKAHIKVPLHTDDPLEAEILKGPVVARIMSELRGQKFPKAKVERDTLDRALLWRDAIAGSSTGSSDVDPRDVLLDTIIHPMVDKGDGTQAEQFLSIVDGRATPIEATVDHWIAANKYQGHTELKARHSVSVLVKWCQSVGILPCFETIDRATGSKFVFNTYIEKNTNSNTANDHISWITRLWKWQIANSSWKGENFWSDLRISGKTAQRMGEKKRTKRPFTNEEVRILLSTDNPLQPTGLMLDFIKMLALTGMRSGELVVLRAGDIVGDCIRIPGGKTAAAERTVPIHHALAELVERRTKGKQPEDRLFHDLPGSESAKRRRGSAMSQAFTRYRRKLGIGERGANSRQDTADMHSFRRWFINSAKERLIEPGIGYTGWTIAEVVGHSTDDEPLGLTMSVYAGPSSIDQLRACVEAVRLPV